MKVMRKLNLLGSGLLTSTNLATDATAEYSSATSYSIGNEVKITGTGGGASVATYKRYRSRTNTNSGNDPTLELVAGHAEYVSPGVSTNWEEIGTVAEWAWASNVYQDQSTKSGSFNVVITPAQRVDAIFLGNLDATSATVYINSPLYGVLHNQTYDLTLPRGLGSWLRWFTEPFSNKKDLALWDLPSATDAVITITIDKGANNASAGAIALGKQLDIGKARKNSDQNLDDYTRAVYLPTSGRTLIDEKSYSKRSGVNVLVDRSRAQVLEQELIALRAAVSIWAIDENDSGTAAMGILEGLSVILKGPRKALFNIRIRSVT